MCDTLAAHTISLIDFEGETKLPTWTEMKAVMEIEAFKSLSCVIDLFLSLSFQLWFAI
jgi:hypothetical protein